MRRCRAACHRSSFGSHGIRQDVCGCRALWTTESYEFPLSDGETAGNLLAVGEDHDSSLPRNLRLPEHPPAGRWELRHFRIASGQKTTTECPRSVKRSEERRVGKECRSRWSPDH